MIVKPELSQKQQQGKDVLQGPHTEILFDGAARSSKTYLICLFLVFEAQKHPKTRHLICRLRLNHLVGTVWHQTLLPILESLYTFKQYKIFHSERIIVLNGKHGKSEIWGAGLDDYERIQKVLGSEYNHIFFNELTQLTFDVFQVVKTRGVMNTPGVENKIIADCNPQNQFHWIHKYFIEKLNPDTGKKLEQEYKDDIIRYGPWLPADNPYLSESGIKRLKSLTGTAHERFYKGLWVSMEGLVYPEYHTALVEPFRIPDDWPVYGGVDFGYSNPFAFLWMAYHHANETYYIFDEYYEREKTVKEHCKFLNEYEPEWSTKKGFDWIVADHDAEDRATMAQEGYPTRAARKDIKMGVERVRDLLASTKGHKVRIFNTCTHLISELAGYKWPDKKWGDDRDEKPVKANDHASDCTRYLCMEIGIKSSVINLGRRRRG